MLDTHDVAFVREHLHKEDLILFLGAGFSIGLQNISGITLPGSSELARQLWAIAFPEAPFDEHSHLQDIFDTARRRNFNATQSRMRELLAVNSAALPTHYQRFLGAPWDRIYSLNVDDVVEAAARAPEGGFEVTSINAVTRHGGKEPASPQALQVVHLNGRIDDGIDAVTFSEADYAARLVSPDGYFQACATDVLTKPTLFIGTRLLEPTLYQSIELRAKSVNTAELLPKSFLVATNIDLARQTRLRDGLKARYVDGTAEDFIRWFVGEFEAELTSARSRKRRLRDQLALAQAVDVSELRLSTEAHGANIALGEEPTWHDVAIGPLPELSFVGAIIDPIAAMEASGERGAVQIVAATAGNGKTTAARAAALRMVAQGNRVAWIDSSDQQFFEMASNVRRQHTRVRPWRAVMIDNAQSRVVDIVHEVQSIRNLPDPPTVVLLARIGGLTTLRERLGGVAIHPTEVVLGPISDLDIERLITWLTDIGRLGELTGLSPDSQARAFRSDARRQLIVALIEATSGRKLKQKVQDEFAELSVTQRSVYAVVALLSSLGHEVTTRSLLIALDAPPMRTQRDISDLANSGLLRRARGDSLTLRHRVVAELTLEALQNNYEFGPVVQSLLLRLAPLVLNHQRRSYEYRVVRSLMNHDFLLRQFDPPTASGLLSTLEESLGWDHHYWLQRGSLALEIGAHHDAEIFLLNAHGRNPDDPLVLTGLGQLRLRQAVATPSASSAEALYAEGEALIRRAMESRLGGDPHHFDILVRSMVEYAMRSDQIGEPRRRLSRDAQSLVSEARRRFPNEPRVALLREYAIHTLTETEVI